MIKVSTISICWYQTRGDCGLRTADSMSVASGCLLRLGGLVRRSSSRRAVNPRRSLPADRLSCGGKRQIDSFGDRTEVPLIAGSTRWSSGLRIARRCAEVQPLPQRRFESGERWSSVQRGRQSMNDDRKGKRWLWDCVQVDVPIGRALVNYVRARMGRALRVPVRGHGWPSRLLHLRHGCVATLLVIWYGRGDAGVGGVHN